MTAVGQGSWAATDEEVQPRFPWRKRLWMRAIREVAVLQVKRIGAGREDLTLEGDGISKAWWWETAWSERNHSSADRKNMARLTAQSCPPPRP